MKLQNAAYNYSGSWRSWQSPDHTVNCVFLRAAKFPAYTKEAQVLREITLLGDSLKPCPNCLVFHCRIDRLATCTKRSVFILVLMIAQRLSNRYIAKRDLVQLLKRLFGGNYEVEVLTYSKTS